MTTHNGGGDARFPLEGSVVIGEVRSAQLDLA
jgi:hypothetical protein